MLIVTNYYLYKYIVLVQETRFGEITMLRKPANAASTSYTRDKKGTVITLLYELKSEAFDLGTKHWLLYRKKSRFFTFSYNRRNYAFWERNSLLSHFKKRVLLFQYELDINLCTCRGLYYQEVYVNKKMESKLSTKNSYLDCIHIYRYKKGNSRLVH